jgi:hypothetical protein
VADQVTAGPPWDESAIFSPNARSSLSPTLRCQPGPIAIGAFGHRPLGE